MKEIERFEKSLSFQRTVRYSLLTGGGRQKAELKTIDKRLTSD